MMKQKNVVPLSVAKFLRKNFEFRENTLYVYNNSREDLRFSLDPSISNQISAPYVYDAIEFLWIMGLKIYYVPEPGTEYCKGVIEVGRKKQILPTCYESPQDALLGCLIYLSKLK